jgi:hypothetical protein
MRHVYFSSNMTIEQARAALGSISPERWAADRHFVFCDQPVDADVLCGPVTLAPYGRADAPPLILSGYRVILGDSDSG